MFERFTERARFVIVLAQDISRELEHPTIGTEHLLLGLVAEREGLASWTLNAVGVDSEAAYQRVADRIPGSGSPAPGQVPFSPALKRAIELANVEVQRRQLTYVGTEHLLLGLLDQLDRAPEPDIAQRVLDDLAVSTQQIRETVERYVPQADGGLAWMLARQDGALHIRGVPGAGWNAILTLRADPQLRRLYLRAAKRARDAEQSTVEVSDLLSAFLSLPEGAELLRREGVSAPAVEPPPPPEPVPEVEAAAEPQPELEPEPEPELEPEPPADQDWTRIEASEEAVAAAIGAERIASAAGAPTVTIRDLLITLASDHGALLAQHGWDLSAFRLRAHPPDVGE